jgi:DNA-binding NarL/FixJ family response regulator
VVVMLTMHTERVYADEAMAAGAAGYVLKSSGAAELRFAIEEVLAGRHYITPLLPAAAVPPGDARRKAEVLQPGAGEQPRALYESLTSRQREVLQMLAQGLSTVEIGQRLGISVKTVEFHRHGIRQELGLTSQAALVRFAVAAGLVAP